MNEPQTYSGQVFMMDEVCLFAITIIPWLSPIRNFWGCVFPINALLRKLSSKESRMETNEDAFHVHDEEWDEYFDSICSPISFIEKKPMPSTALSLSSLLSLPGHLHSFAWGVAAKVKVGPLTNAKTTFALLDFGFRTCRPIWQTWSMN